MKNPRFDSLSEAYRIRAGAQCACIPWTRGQIVLYLTALLALIGAFLLRPIAAWQALNYGLALFLAAVLGLRLSALLVRLFRDVTRIVPPETAAALTDADLPLYSILVPLYREPEVVPGLLASLDALDYPKAKLDVQLLLEPDDPDTRQMLDEVSLPRYVRVTLSPGGMPRTKPRACNTGLAGARGSLAVIYDAEDRPEPDQLRKAVAAYRALPADVVCLQCRLSHYNSRQSLASRWSEMEYLVWYRYLLPGLQALGAPLPLGGTSNHFRTAALRELGGWDPFNVTEDCDLGMRICRRGWRTQMLASTTWEESVHTLGGWVRQRSRWFKGYWQTWLVHSRRGSLREFGLRRGLLFLLLVGGCSAMLVNPLLWSAIAAWTVLGWPIVDAASPLSCIALALGLLMLAANAAFVVLNMAVCILERRPDLAPAALLSPLEWALLSAAAWKGWLQFFARPFYWEKTHHGRFSSDRAPADADDPFWRRHFPALASLAILLAAGVGVAAFVSFRIERQIASQRPEPPVQLPSRFSPAALASARLLYGFETGAEGWTAESNRSARVAAGVATEGARALCVGLSLPRGTRLHVSPDADWSAHRGLSMNLFVPADAPEDIRVTLFCRDADLRWYQFTSPQRLLPGAWTRVEAGLRAADGCWRPRGHQRPWDGYAPQRIREFGLKAHGSSPWVGPLRIDQFQAIPFAEAELPDRVALTIATRGKPPERTMLYARYEADFDLSRVYANPFNPDGVEVHARFQSPTGREIDMPAFFTADFTRRLTDAGERLTPAGPAHWRVRFAPLEIGRYQVSIHARDARGGAARIDLPPFEVTPSSLPGFVRRSSAKPQFLAHDNGRPFYPIGHNVAFPVDNEQPFPYPFAVPSDQGTFTYDRWFARMAANGENWGRVWISPFNLGIEGPRAWTGYGGMGRYSLAQAWRLDHVIDEAERQGLYLNLTLQHKCEFAKRSWPSHPYAAVNGGPLDQPEAFFTDPQSLAAHRNRIRYLVARWGYSPHVMAWELWGEVNLVPRFNQNSGAVTDWHADMARLFQRIDPGRHLVFTHCHNWQVGNELWALPEIDCVQGNGYIRPPNPTPNQVENFRRYLSEVEAFRKPVFVAEYGGRSELGAPSADYLEAQFHSGLWASILQPFAGAAASWWWNFIDGADLYFHFRAPSAFVRDIDRIRDDYHEITPEATGADATLRAIGMQSDVLTAVWVYHKDVFTKWADLPTVEGATIALRGLNRPPYQVEYWDTTDARIVGRTNLVHAGTARLDLPPVRRDLAIRVRAVSSRP